MIDQHLQECDLCQSEAQRWEDFLNIWRQYNPAEIAAENFLHRLHDRIPSRKHVPTRRLVMVAASLILVISLSLLFGWQRELTQPTRIYEASPQVLERLIGTQPQIEQRILDVLDQSITTLRESEEESLCDEEIL